MFRIPLATSSTSVAPSKFWLSVLLYHNRPHLVNRKIISASQQFLCEITVDKSLNLDEVFTKHAILHEFRKLQNAISIDFIVNLIQFHQNDAVIVEKSLDYVHELTKGVFVSVRFLLSRKGAQKCLEIVILDKNRNFATFKAVGESNAIDLAPNFSYHIELVEDKLRVTVDCFEDADTTSGEWLADKLFPKLLKWTENISGDQPILSSLSLISPEKYCDVYDNLKLKYASQLVELVSDNTSVDPQKFVYEDVAIAAYLICIWKKYSLIEVSFVDCGCGNGLLVYLLNREGYQGYGVDVRKRKIWDHYPEQINLKVETVLPTSLYPNCTWLIGNHSDELTPWIPVISAKSSPQSNFFLLPCCPFDLSGKKYARINSSVSQYSDYLHYVENIATRCGFHVKIDKLRIPSTKRTCLLGIATNREATLDIAQFEIGNYVTRSPIEKVRNCTKLNKSLIDRLIRFVVNIILSKQDFSVEKSNGDRWNKGGTVTLSDLCAQIEKDDLKQLKKECGGLQTLLRNHRYLFEVEKGCVKLREPYKLNPVTSKYKNKPCWFFRNHPDGCLYESTTCAYNHVL